MPFGVLIVTAASPCRPRAAYATGKFSWRAGTVVPTGTIAAKPGAALASTAEEGTLAPPEPLPRPRVSLWQRGPHRASPSPMVNPDPQNLKSITAQCCLGLLPLTCCYVKAFNAICYNTAQCPVHLIIVPCAMRSPKFPDFMAGSQQAGKGVSLSEVGCNRMKAQLCSLR